MKIGKRFSQVSYCGNNLEIFSTAKDDENKKAHSSIKKIDEPYDNTRTKKVQMEGKTKKYPILLILMQGKAVIIYKFLDVAKQNVNFVKKLECHRKFGMKSQKDQDSFLYQNQ